jgi:membrane associated rhomboid family serine protease
MRRIWITPETKLLRVGGRPPRVTLGLLALHATIFLLYVFAAGPSWVRQHLAVSAAATFGRGELWQPLTAVWLHLNARTLLLDLGVLWLLGAPMERWWGERRFAACYLASGVGGLTAAAVLGLSRPATLVCGATGGTLALLLAGAVVYGEHLVLWGQHTLGLRVRPTALIVGGAVLLLALVDRAWLDLTAAAVGAAIGASFLHPIARWAPGLRRRLRRRARPALRSVGRRNDAPPHGPN